MTYWENVSWGWYFPQSVYMYVIIGGINSYYLE